jgi:glutamate 5-kinase
VEDGTLDGAALVKLVTALAALMDAGHRCLLVSSGAVGSGVASFQLDGYPRDIVTRQACAAVGQARLMQAYGSLFANFGITVAQVLLTAADLGERFSHISSTLHRLLDEPRIIPIINENDSVAIEELKVGDNDQLSSRVAVLTGAKRLILLTSAEGLLTPDSAEPIPEVNNIDDVMKFVRDDQGKFSIGGMASKLTAVKYAVENGVETWIANGRKPERLIDLVNGHGICATAANSLNYYVGKSSLATAHRCGNLDCRECHGTTGAAGIVCPQSIILRAKKCHVTSHGAGNPSTRGANYRSKSARPTGSGGERTKCGNARSSASR